MQSVNSICTFVYVKVVSVAPMLSVWCPRCQCGAHAVSVVLMLSIQAYNCWSDLSLLHVLSVIGALLMQM